MLNAQEQKSIDNFATRTFLGIGLLFAGIILLFITNNIYVMVISISGMAIMMYGVRESSKDYDRMYRHNN